MALDQPGGFVYRSLRRDVPEIRLLDLHPAAGHDSPLQCTIKHAPLYGSRFCALSYVWGDQSLPRSGLGIWYKRGFRERFSRDKNQPPTRKDIGNSLAAALRHIRSAHDVVTIWTDALCINQDDKTERSWQVLLMTGIYSHATSVHAWLGPRPTDGREIVSKISTAFSYINQIWRLAQRTQGCERLSVENDLLQACFVIAQTSSESSQQQDSRAQHIWGPFASKLRIAVRFQGLLYSALDPLHAFSQLEYFQRIWILQETGRARTLTFHYGQQQAAHKQVLLSLSLARALWASAKVHQTRPPEKFDERFMKCMTARTTCINGLSLVDVLKFAYLERSRMHNATDPRDLVYALMGLAKSQQGIPVDYNASVEQVYVWTARFLLEQGFTDLLVKFRTYSSSKGLLSEHLPSWAHDWSTRSLPFFTRFRAAKDTQQQLSFVTVRGSESNPGLKIRGIVVGRVMRLGSTFSASATAAGLTPKVVGSGRLSNGDQIELSAEDKRILGARFAQLYHNIKVHADYTRLQTLLDESRLPLASFWCWWLEWMQSLNVLLGQSDRNASVNYSDLDIADMLLREAPQRLRNSNIFSTPAKQSITNPNVLLNMLLPSAPDGPAGRLSQSSIELAESLFRSAWCTRLLRLSGGRICSAPEATQLGDEIIICRGVNAPLVIRSDTSGAHRIIGPAYVCGAMDGQMLGNNSDETIYIMI